jgi:hypothetical protein
MFSRRKPQNEQLGFQPGPVEPLWVLHQKWRLQEKVSLNRTPGRSQATGNAIVIAVQLRQ